MEGRQDELIRAVDLALSGDWDAAHAVAQRFESNANANWLHALLHKIEGDEGNSRYWYHRSGGHAYEDFTDVKAELAAIRTDHLAAPDLPARNLADNCAIEPIRTAFRCSA